VTFIGLLAGRMSRLSARGSRPVGDHFHLGPQMNVARQPGETGWLLQAAQKEG
jgi:hypothetical protein